MDNLSQSIRAQTGKDLQEAGGGWPPSLLALSRFSALNCIFIESSQQGAVMGTSSASGKAMFFPGGSGGIVLHCYSLSATEILHLHDSSFSDLGENQEFHSRHTFISEVYVTTLQTGVCCLCSLYYFTVDGLKILFLSSL